MCSTMNSRFVQWVTSFVPWVGDHVLLESKREQVNKPLEPTQQELVDKASHEEGFSETFDVGQL